MKVYFVRHGQSNPRDFLSYEEAGEVGLSSFGEKQVRALAKTLRKYTIEKIYVSPLRRARETANIVSAGNIPVIVDERLKEWRISNSLTGRAYKEMRIRMQKERNFSPDDGEAFNECAKRFISFLEDILEEEDEPIVVVGHALIFQSALVTLCKLEHIPAIDEGSLSLLEGNGGVWRIVFLNKRPWFYDRLWRGAKAKIQKIFRRSISYGS
ncbi:MAG: hypothetical protein COV08_02455 [Candidatus Vogelbacteria bacterium CG10_big_fil_rev_8_21_14_0_10_49_38]|uniref:Histidine phosphatase family protein n=1 Tax=Candidatus Vogelbacteria bacterium CG10_big_fil_rev_8_21_14_0_10_49_38 TaxID=1975043 RepID=A0A2H0RJH1_9BACT|nr:MAG: hypothetical protein BK006_02475 [bacterium CG10_49_38]PIR45925.1 MAG: hypothetical protein COV08_02455 [Candidatus Vogelbacteria bacterium CG10_big_fil_rev_8_21_14_0_10_49_38]